MLRHQVQIQQSVVTRDTTGAEIETWQDVATRHAEIAPLVGREQFLAQQINATTSHRVRLRYLPGVTPKMRVLYGARILMIDGILNPEERNIELQLVCTEVV